MFLKNLPAWLLALACAGCAGKESVPMAPTPMPTPPLPGSIGFVWGYVFSDGPPPNQCLTDATVEVVDGAKGGAQSLQKECDFDNGIGYQFRDLVIGERVTLRASKPGYRSQDRQILISNGGRSFDFILVKE